MSGRLPSLNGLRAFEAAARHLSFTVAAAELNVTQTAISHQIKRLEQELGIRLFVRKNRALALTPAAQRLPAGGPGCIQRPAAGHRPAAAQGQHHVLIVRSLASLPANGYCRGFGISGGQSRRSMSHHHSTELVDFQRGDVDAAIRYGRGQWPGLRADWLMADQIFPVCSPTLLQGERPLRQPEDLADHVLLHTSGAALDDWRLWLTAAGLPADLSSHSGLTFDMTFVTI